MKKFYHCAAMCAAVLMAETSFSAEDCLPREFPPGLGGAIDDGVSVDLMLRWKDYKRARSEERMLDAYDPQRVAETYQLSSALIEKKCVTQAQLVDLGRALFLKEFVISDYVNSRGEGQSNLQRFSAEKTTAPHATSCISCHWKGGFAGAGDVVDNAFLEGDGNRLDSHKVRNPIALHGAGWVELLAKEMSDDLQKQLNVGLARVSSAQPLEVPLTSKGVRFGSLILSKDSHDKVSVNADKLLGVDADLVVKPFAWEGRFSSIEEVVRWSFETHMGIGTYPDSSVKQLSKGQLAAVTQFIATLAAPIIEIPTSAGFRPEPILPILESKHGVEYTNRWSDGLNEFNQMGCSSCHKPSLALGSSNPTLNELKNELSKYAATPNPISVATDNKAGSDKVGEEKTEVYLFSDLKRHSMGYGTFLTRPLWGLRNSAPYMHDGSANVVDQAIQQHGQAGSAAKKSAEKFAKSTEKRKADLRIFLYSLMRSPSIRVR